MKHFKNFIVVFFTALILFNCSDKKTEPATNINLLNDSVPEISIESDSARPVLPDGSEISNGDWDHKYPQTDTNIFYGYDYDGDSVIYKEGSEILKEGDLIANFIEIQRGDFVHIVLKDSVGWYHSFFVYLDNEKQMNKYWEGYAPKPLQKLKIHWKRQRIVVSDGGATTLAYCAVKIQNLN